METQWQDDVRDKHHWTILYKWWTDNDKMMFERIIIVYHQINGA